MEARECDRIRRESRDRVERSASRGGTHSFLKIILTDPTCKLPGEKNAGWDICNGDAVTTGTSHQSGTSKAITGSVPAHGGKTDRAFRAEESDSECRWRQ